EHLAFQFPQRFDLQPTVPYQGKTEGVLRFLARQTGCCVEQPVEFSAQWHFTIVSRDTVGDLLQLPAVGKRMLDDDEQFFQFRRNLDDWRQNQYECPVLFATGQLLDKSLDDFGRLEKPMEVHEH